MKMSNEAETQLAQVDDELRRQPQFLILDSRLAMAQGKTEAAVLLLAQWPQTEQADWMEEQYQHLNLVLNQQIASNAD